MPNATPASVGMSPTRLDRIAPAMARYIDSGAIAGASVAVTRRGVTVYEAEFGQSDREAQRAMSPDTIFRIYSMTKPVVSTALMLLHEEARFQLEEPVAKYLPAFGGVEVLNADGTLAAPQRPMDIADVLAHTAGLTYDFMADNPVAALYRDAEIMHDATRSLQDLMAALAEIPLAWHPGSRWHYSVGIDVAAALIEVIADEPLGAFLQRRLFDPLGMTDTGFGVPSDRLDRLAAMYGLPDLIGKDYEAMQLVAAGMAGFNERIDVSATYPTDTPDVFQRGGLGLFSTRSDYLRFAQMLADGGTVGDERIVGRKTLELMHSNHLPAALLPYELLGMPSPGYGFGLGSRVMMDPAASKGTGTSGEFGWAGAAKTYYFVDPQEELVGLFMTQYMTGPLGPDRDFRSLVYQAIDD